MVRSAFLHAFRLPASRTIRLTEPFAPTVLASIRYSEKANHEKAVGSVGRSDVGGRCHRLQLLRLGLLPSADDGRHAGLPAGGRARRDHRRSGLRSAGLRWPAGLRWTTRVRCPDHPARGGGLIASAMRPIAAKTRHGPRGLLPKLPRGQTIHRKPSLHPEGDPLAVDRFVAQSGIKSVGSCVYNSTLV